MPYLAIQNIAKKWTMSIHDGKPALNRFAPELRTFAAGINRDQAAILTALTSAWSQGQVEGQIHRLKLIKRQAYGCAGFDLLRHRVLACSA